MTKNRAKLIAAAVTMLVAFSLLGMGTYAWMTISQSTEVSGLGVTINGDGANWPFEISPDGNDETYEKELHVFSDYYADYNAGTYASLFNLRPISTYDGVNWFTARFDSAGNVAGFNSVPSVDLVANIEKSSESVISGDGDAETSNYLIYQDFWIRTLDKTASGNKQYALKLNKPKSNPNDWETLYGTYVLPAPYYDEESGGYKINPDGKEAVKCMRLGFLVYPDSINTTTNFAIYEPAADVRSNFNLVAGVSEMADTTYVKGSDSSDDKEVGTYTSVGPGFNETFVPAAEDGELVMKSTESITISQAESTWNEAALAACNSYPDSRCISSIGDFLTEAEGLASLDGIDTPALAYVKYGQPVKMRVFFWIEGQDVDCWNQIMGNGIVANIEFRGELVTTGSGN